MIVKETQKEAEQSGGLLPAAQQVPQEGEEEKSARVRARAKDQEVEEEKTPLHFRLHQRK